MTDKLETYTWINPENSIQLSEIAVRPIGDEWARLDPDGKLVFLDMDKCVRAGNDAFALLAIGVWNAAIEEAAKEADFVLQPGGETLGDVIRRMKK